MGIGFSLVGRRGVGAGRGGGGGGGGGIARMWCWLPCDPSLQWEQKNYSFTRAANSERRKKTQPVRSVRKQQIIKTLLRSTCRRVYFMHNVYTLSISE